MIFPDVIEVRNSLLPATEREKNIAADLKDISWFDEIDAAGKSAVKMMLKTWIKDAAIKDVGAYFAVSDAKEELSAWTDKIKVSERGYTLGYQSLDVPSVKRIYRILAKIGDDLMKMKIVRIDFKS